MNNKLKYKIKLDNFLSNTNKDTFIAYYYAHLDCDVYIFFSLTKKMLSDILINWNITKKTAAQISKLKSRYYKPRQIWTKAKIDAKLKKLGVDKSELIKFYKTELHSARETWEHFNITESQLYWLLKVYNIVKSKEEAKQSSRNSTIRYCLEKYGTTNGGWTTAAQLKIKQTNLKKFGTEWSWQSDNNKSKANKTKLEKYGRTNIGQVNTLEHKQAMLNKYGVSTPMESAEIKQRLDKNMVAKYGVNRYAKTLEFHKKARKRYSYTDKQCFDSSWELALWIYAKDHNEEIERCPVVFEYTFNGKAHKYCPDFKYLGQLIEIKGDNWFKDGKMVCPTDHSKNELYEAKHLCGLANNVIFWLKQDIKFALDYCTIKYNNKKWYEQFLKRGK